jgi:hypothetical protein
MDRFLGTYTVEFPRPANPAGWPLANFELALDHLLTEQIVELKAAGDGTNGIHLAGVKGVAVREIAPGKHEYVVSHDVLFDPPTTAQARLEPAERLRLFLADVLGITPRQWEGPWNIVALTVKPA